MIIFDGTSLASVAFHADGSDRFFSMCRKVIEDLNESYFVFAFDNGEENHRKIIYPEYKAHRTPSPGRAEFCHRIAESLLNSGFCVLYGPEADDVIYTVRRRFHDQPVTIVTKDQDLFSLIDSTTVVMWWGKNFQDRSSIDADGVLNLTGVPVEKYKLYKSLVGDKSDNIPGVSGVGPKYAKRMLEFGTTLEELYGNLPPQLMKVFKMGYEDAKTSLELVSLIELPLPKIRVKRSTADFSDATSCFNKLNNEALYQLDGDFLC